MTAEEGRWLEILRRRRPIFSSMLLRVLLTLIIILSGASAFADVRVSLDGVPLASFAGHTTWDPPTLRWSHLIDLADGVPALADVGVVSWESGDLIERGSTLVDGVVVPYVEVWRRLPGADGLVVEENDATRWRVVVGPHELVADDQRAAGGVFSACYRRDGAVVVQITSGVTAS
jgi:hypothetical protein